MLPEVKMCGMTNLEDAEFALSQGASIVGVVLSDQSPRKGTPELVGSLSKKGYSVAGVYTEMSSVVENSTSEEYIQLHFSHGKEEIELVHDKLHKKVISVVFPQKSANLMKTMDQLLDYGSDLVLVDFGREITSEDIPLLSGISGKRIGIAGKLWLETLPVVVSLNPYFLDLSSRLEVYPGKKDHHKIAQFMEVLKHETAAV